MDSGVWGRILWLVTLCSLLYVHSVHGKYVKGVVDTKEVSSLLSVSVCPPAFVCLYSGQMTWTQNGDRERAADSTA